MVPSWPGNDCSLLMQGVGLHGEVREPQVQWAMDGLKAQEDEARQETTEESFKDWGKSQGTPVCANPGSMKIPGAWNGGTYDVYDVCKGYVKGYTPKVWPYMVQYLHFRILKFPLTRGDQPYYLRDQVHPLLSWAWKCHCVVSLGQAKLGSVFIGLRLRFKVCSGWSVFVLSWRGGYWSWLWLPSRLFRVGLGAAYGLLRVSFKLGLAFIVVGLGITVYIGLVQGPFGVVSGLFRGGAGFV